VADRGHQGEPAAHMQNPMIPMEFLSALIELFNLRGS
jgi:hypothetical protein